MPIIRADEREGRCVLLVHCVEPLTKRVPVKPPYDRVVLESAVAVCPGAGMEQIGHEHIPCPMDFGDEWLHYGLEPTRENVLALRAAGFEWSREAWEIAAGFELAKGEIDEARDRAWDHLERRGRDLAEAFRRISEMPAVAAGPAMKKRRWWAFWRSA
jgi:hypothetical protein